MRSFDKRISHEETIGSLAAEYGKALMEVARPDQGRWGFTYLWSDPRLSSDDRAYLLTHATLMYLTNKERAVVKTEALEGRLFLSKGFMVVGSISGKQFTAELDTNDGPATVRLLVNERTCGLHQDN